MLVLKSLSDNFIIISGSLFVDLFLSWYSHVLLHIFNNFHWMLTSQVMLISIWTFSSPMRILYMVGEVVYESGWDFWDLFFNIDKVALSSLYASSSFAQLLYNIILPVYSVCLGIQWGLFTLDCKNLKSVSSKWILETVLQMANSLLPHKVLPYSCIT